MASVTRESIGNLHDKITVKLEKQDYLPSFEKDIKSYTKRANIPGFRKGMVPLGMIKKMVGKELYADAVVKSAEKELRDYLLKEKIDFFGQPLFLNDKENFPSLDLQNPKDYEFLFEIGLRPDVEIKFPENASLKLFKVKVKPEDIEQRVENFQDQFGELKEAESVEGPENVINLHIDETDEKGELKEGGFSGNTTLYVKAFSDEFQQQLIGKKKDDILTGILNKIIDPEKYAGVYENLGINPEDEQETGVSVQVKISNVNTLEKAPLNEELYKKAFPSKEIATEEEFRKTVEEDEQKYWDDAANNYLEHNLHHLLLDIPVSLPEEFLKKMMEDPAKPLSQEEINQQYPSFSNQLKWTLISGKIIQDQKIEVTAEELKEDIRTELRNYFQNMSLGSSDNEWLENYVERVMADQKQTEQRMDKLLVKKVFDWAKTQVQIKEEETSQEDFQKELSEHQHHH